jgi:hypothetical protein
MAGSARRSNGIVSVPASPFSECEIYLRIKSQLAQRVNRALSLASD